MLAGRGKSGRQHLSFAAHTLMLLLIFVQEQKEEEADGGGGQCSCKKIV